MAKKREPYFKINPKNSEKFWERYPSRYHKEEYTFHQQQMLDGEIPLNEIRMTHLQQLITKCKNNMDMDNLEKAVQLKIMKERGEEEISDFLYSDEEAEQILQQLEDEYE